MTTFWVYIAVAFGEVSRSVNWPGLRVFMIVDADTVYYTSSKTQTITVEFDDKANVGWRAIIR